MTESIPLPVPAGRGIDGGADEGRAAIVTSVHATDAPSFELCPLCHSTLTADAAAQYWTCGRCGQGWTARRLATVAAYRRYIPGGGPAAAGEPPAPPRLPVPQAA